MEPDLNGLGPSYITDVLVVQCLQLALVPVSGLQHTRWSCGYAYSTSAQKACVRFCWSKLME